MLRMRQRRGAWPGVGEIVAAGGHGRAARAVRRLPAPPRRGRRGRGRAAARDRRAARRARRASSTPRAAAPRPGSARGLDEPEAALLRGMVLGQDEQLTDDVRDDFKRSGLAHVLAVSGQNVMLLATLVLRPGALLGPRRCASRLLVRARAGRALRPAHRRRAVDPARGRDGRGRPRRRARRPAGAPLVRARARRRGHARAQPARVGRAGLAALVRRRRRAARAGAAAARRARPRGCPGRSPTSPRSPIAATLGTAPLMALHFEQVSLAALPANLLAAAAIAPVMWLGMLAAAAAQVAPALAAPFNALNAPLLAFVEWVAHTMAGAPGGGAAGARALAGGARRRLRGARGARSRSCARRARWRRRLEPPAVRGGARASVRRAAVAAALAAALLLGRPRSPAPATAPPPLRRRARGLVPRHRPGRRDADPERPREPCSSTPGRRAGRSCGGCARPASGGSTRSCSRTRRPTTRAWRSRSCARYPDAARGRRRRRLADARAARAARRGRRRARAPDRRPRRPGADVRRDPRCGCCGRRRPGRASARRATRTTGRSSPLVAVGDFDLLLPADAESERHRRARRCRTSRR